MAMVPAIAIVIAIFYFSSQPAVQSTATSDGVTRLLLAIADRLHLLELQSVDVPAVCAFLSMPVRKWPTSPNTPYSACPNLRRLRAWGLRGKQLLRAALALTFFYACTDEFHQLFVPGRAGRFSDVLIDSSGAALIRVLAPMFWRHDNEADQPNRLVQT